MRERDPYNEYESDIDNDFESEYESDPEETWHGECNLVFSGYRKVTLEPTYPPAPNVKQYLEALWRFEDDRRRALEVKAAVKSVLRRLPADVADRICESVSRRLELQLAVKAAQLSAARDAALYKSEAVYRQVWHNPAEDD